MSARSTTRDSAPALVIDGEVFRKRNAAMVGR